MLWNEGICERNLDRNCVSFTTVFYITITALYLSLIDKKLNNLFYQSRNFMPSILYEFTCHRKKILVTSFFFQNKPR